MRPMVLLLPALLLGCAAAPSAGGPAWTTVVITTAARAHEVVGQNATVVGTVAQVKTGAHHGHAYLNFGARHPDETFSVLIPDSVLARFGDLTRFEGHSARATGMVWLQDGRYPAMTLTDPATLEFGP